MPFAVIGATTYTQNAPLRVSRSAPVGCFKATIIIAYDVCIVIESSTVQQMYIKERQKLQNTRRKGLALWGGGENLEEPIYGDPFRTGVTRCRLLRYQKGKRPPLQADKSTDQWHPSNPVIDREANSTRTATTTGTERGAKTALSVTCLPKTTQRPL